MTLCNQKHVVFVFLVTLIFIFNSFICSAYSILVGDGRENCNANIDFILNTACVMEYNDQIIQKDSLEKSFYIANINDKISSHNISSENTATKGVLQESNHESDNVLGDSLSQYDTNLNIPYEISSWRYFVVIIVMFAVLAILYIVRIRQNKGQQISNIILEQAKILDSKNKVAVIRYGNTRYVIGLNPNGIALLDRIQLESVESKNSSSQYDSQDDIFTKQDSHTNFFQLLLQSKHKQKDLNVKTSHFKSQNKDTVKQHQTDIKLCNIAESKKES
ncbi:hypothetical protein CQA53_01530 [Helicobacter didelphidarum]|uniref:Flagellar protein n=1 Tax=Helicobacter didelphidarum TaxID=2040648 RepID=A0A3D8IPD1_9HELI|nr:flagellar biosynthetic protein FliO [Helicobacter didelphidarum]RDU66973.1 hypothetical protein CQA53_01530 [Helicobacter didelphidarum]